ncbi:MAG: DUF1353 domain-containing protein [Paracoccaceae bacterium]|nr:DUF1353 domain-containing protein [Paracoccaceae bacterium]
MRYAMLSLACVALSGCVFVPAADRLNLVEAMEVTCQTQPEGCSFDQSPLQMLNEPVTLPRRPLTFFPTAERLTFRDPRGVTWVAPRRTLTDGASIPLIFVPIIGKPTAPEYVNAAAVHDAYCGVGNEQGERFHQAEWEDVHRMFFDALITGGTPPVRAKLMFAAVWLGGPRWETYQQLDHVPVGRLKQAMRRAQNFISREDPSLQRLLNFLKQQEKAVLQDFPRGGENAVMREESSSSESMEPYDGPIDLGYPTVLEDGTVGYPSIGPFDPGDPDVGGGATSPSVPAVGGGDQV